MPTTLPCISRFNLFVVRAVWDLELHTSVLVLALARKYQKTDRRLENSGRFSGLSFVNRWLEMIPRPAYGGLGG